MAQNRQGGGGVNEMFTPAQEGTPGYYEQTVRRLFRTGRWGEGHKLLTEGMERYGWLSALNELMGQYWLHQKAYDKARYYLIRSLRDDKNNLHAKEMLLRVEQDTRHYSTALVYCNELLEASPYDETLWRRKIQLFRLMGNEAEASRLLQRLGTIYPDRPEVRKALAWDWEERYRQARKAGDLATQEQALRQLVTQRPEDSEFQMALCNLLLQSGRSGEAAEVAGRAALVTGAAVDFVCKRAGILAEEHRYLEAMDCVRDAQKRPAGKASDVGRLTTLLADLEQEAARDAVARDAYTAYARVYDKQHTDEALDYLVRTSLTRGYLDEALYYIRQGRKRRGDTQDLLFKEYTVQCRLGNTHAAAALLETMHQRWPDNTDVSEALSIRRMDEATRLYLAGQYAEAIPLLEALQKMDLDAESRMAATRKLYACYTQTGRYEIVLPWLEVQTPFPKDDYEQAALPYIKRLVKEGRTEDAWAQWCRTWTLCDPSADLLTQGISLAQTLGQADRAAELIALGREKYPEDPYFIQKEQGLILSQAEACERQKDWEGALALYRQYHPSACEQAAFNRHLETVCRHTLHHSLNVDYQTARLASQDQLTSTTLVDYTLQRSRNTYTLGLGYAGRDGVKASSGNPDLTEGGAGIQLNVGWQHTWTSRLSTTLTGGVANRFFPRLKAGLSASWQLPHDWQLDAKTQMRLIHSDTDNTLITLGAGVGKPLGLFHLIADASAFLVTGRGVESFGGRLFVHGSLKALFYPTSNPRTHLYLYGGAGNAPELSLLDNSMPVVFNELNTTLGVGGRYFVNRHIDVGLSGSWYTIITEKPQSDQPTNYKNYLYVNANLTIHF